MKPKVLKISGLNSFEEEVKIDFSKLIEKGLFGIFGRTGSGKSSILDAITIALYGEISRDSKQYINVNCKNLEVSYEFEIGLGKEKKDYIVERNIRRKKSKNDNVFSGYITKYARLLEQNEEEKIIIAEGAADVKKNVEEILGLSHSDFTRSVVLPQGKFSEFLKLKGKDRRNMLERIFALEKYGNSLTDKIRKVRNKNLQEKNKLEGAVSKYTDVSKEILEEFENKHNDAISEEKNLINKKSKLDKDYETFKEIWELQKELSIFEENMKQLENEKEDIEIKKHKLKLAEKANFIKPYIETLKNNKLRFNENNELLENSKKILIDTESKLRKSESEYENAENNRNIRIPELIKKEMELKEASKKNKEMLKHKEEIESFRVEYKKYKSEKDSKNKTIEELEKKIADSSSEIISIEERLKEIKTPTDIREKVRCGAEIESKFKEIKSNKEKLSKKISEKKKKIIESKEDYNKKLKELGEKAEAINIINKNLEKLRENCPGNRELLIQKQEKYSELKNKFNEAFRQNSRKVEFEKKMIPLSESKVKLSNELKIRNESIEKVENIIVEIKEKIRSIELGNMASLLADSLTQGESCPVCGSIHHEKLAEKIDSSLIEEEQNKVHNLEAKLQEENKNNINVEKKLAKVESEIEIITEEINKIVVSLDNINIDDFSKKVNNEEEKFLKLKEDISKWDLQVQELEGKLKNEKEVKNEISIHEARLKEILTNENKIHEDMLNEQKELIEAYEKISKEYLSIKEELKLDNIREKLSEINKFDKEIEEKESRLKNLRNSIESAEKKKQLLSPEINEYEKKMNAIEEVGKEKKNSIDKLLEEIKQIAGDKNIEEYSKEVIEEKNKIEEQISKIKKNLEDDRKMKEEVQNKVVSYEQNKTTLNEMILENQNELNKKLADAEFENQEKAEANMLDSDMISKISDEIVKYDDNFKKVSLNISRINLKLEDKRITNEQWTGLLCEKDNTNELLNNKTKEVAALNENIQRIKRDLNVLKDILEEYKKVSHKLELLGEIESLVKGNKFVEFVAINHLKYIAREASKRLKEITNERYALEIDVEGNFTIRDDKNGGIRREAGTLSGGETFLASLALALSLSSQIQLKGSAPLEFFFLDEGFGTLDSDLLDVVMNSLERLHSEKLSVGIISHVEELKNRIPVKLIVTPSSSGEGGSKVKLEYS